MGHALLGRTQAERGAWGEAIQAFERGLELSADSTFLKALLALKQAAQLDAEAKAGSSAARCTASRSR